jgi:hypothetical protein
MYWQSGVRTPKPRMEFASANSPAAGEPPDRSSCHPPLPKATITSFPPAFRGSHPPPSSSSASAVHCRAVGRRSCSEQSTRRGQGLMTGLTRVTVQRRFAAALALSDMIRQAKESSLSAIQRG